jgi:hypothetical protein
MGILARRLRRWRGVEGQKIRSRYEDLDSLPLPEQRLGAMEQKHGAGSGELMEWQFSIGA